MSPNSRLYEISIAIGQSASSVTGCRSRLSMGTMAWASYPIKAWRSGSNLRRETKYVAPVRGGKSYCEPGDPRSSGNEVISSSKNTAAKFTCDKAAVMWAIFNVGLPIATADFRYSPAGLLAKYCKSFKFQLMTHILMNFSKESWHFLNW